MEKQKPSDMLIALRRAAKAARKLSRETGTPFVVWREGKVVDLNAIRDALSDGRINKDSRPH